MLAQGASPADGVARPRPPVRSALRNHALVRTVLALFTVTIAEWALWIGTLVYAHARGGASAAGFVSIALVVPAACIAPLAGRQADGPRPIRLLAIVYGSQTLFLIVAAVAAHQHAALAVVVVPVAASTTLVTFIPPTCSVAIPSLVTIPEQLTAANLLVGYVNNAATLVGPLLAAALLAVGGAAMVLGGCVVLVAVSTLCCIPLAELDPPFDAALREPSIADPLHRVSLVAVKRLAERPGALALLGVLGGQYVLIGGLDLLVVVLATEQLHLGASGPGLLSATFGVGALAGGGLSTLLVGRRRLAPLIAASLSAIVVALAVLGGETVLVAALVLLPVMGIGRSVLDVTGNMLLQRAAPQDALASVFAALEVLVLAGMAIGSLVVQILIAVADVRAALLGLSCALGLLLLLTVRRLRHIDDIADAPVVVIRLLRSTRIFARLPPAEMEGVARAGCVEHRAAGATIIRTGDVGDKYYVIADGTVNVIVGGRLVAELRRFQGFGEIALISDLPRTATVVAVTDVDLFAIARAPFLAVLRWC
ncbi:MAG: transporter [Ilumatobacteraceae bacterium]|nr:transporter [Ilumatobacteraceae bacterium]